MKNTRKKMLLSSVAMLLVALVALGSATYAWFSLNKTVSASNLNVKAAASKGLKINIENQADGKWTETATYTGLSDAAKTIKPVSISYKGQNTDPDALPAATSAFFPQTVNGADGLVWSSANNANVKDWTNAGSYPTVNASGEGVGNNDYFVAYEFAVKGEGLGTGEKFKGVTATITVTDSTETNVPAISDFVRVALVKESTTTPAFTGSGTTLKGVVGNESTAKAISAISPVAETTQSTLTNSGATISLDDVDGTATNYSVLIWFEGQDGQCLNNHVAANGTISISVDATSIGT